MPITEHVVISAQDRTAAALRSARSNVERLNGSFRALGGRVGTVTAILGGAGLIGKMIELASANQKAMARLEAVNGSAERAGVVYRNLERYSVQSGIAMDGLTEASIRLKALGLDPSIEAIESYANISAAMGTSILQFAEAVADGSVAEMERLKEFGIKASKQGEQVTFTFKGVKTSIKNDAEDIEKYLQSIGKVQFAGAAKKQADTLGGALDALGSAFNRLIHKIDTETGFTGAIGRAAKGLTNFLNDLAGAPRSLEDLQGELKSLESTLQSTDKTTSGFLGDSTILIESRISHLKSLIADLKKDAEVIIPIKKKKSPDDDEGGEIVEPGLTKYGKWKESAEQMAQDTTFVWVDAFNSISSGFDNTFDAVISGQKTALQGLKDTARSAIASVIKNLIKLGVQKSILWAAEKAGIISTTATSTAAAGTTAAAWTAPAALVSLGSFGSNALVAAAGIAAVMAAVSGIAHDGLDYVPNTGTYILEKGERVVKKQDNKKLESALNNGGMGGGSRTVNLNVSIQALDTQNASEALLAQEDTILAMVQKGFNENAMAGPYGR